MSDYAVLLIAAVAMVVIGILARAEFKSKNYWLMKPPPERNPRMKLPALTAKRRVWLYGVAATGLTAAAVAKWIDPAVVPAWLLFAGTVLGVSGNATAAFTVAKQRRDGILP